METTIFLQKNRTKHCFDLTKNNNLILDVCFEPDKAEYTDGSRWYMLNLSQNGKVLYGLSVELNKYYGEMYGVKKKKYKK